MEGRAQPRPLRRCSVPEPALRRVALRATAQVAGKAESIAREARTGSRGQVGGARSSPAKGRGTSVITS
eukprot:4311400-Lingulodinium_polyedra.AAC.1